MAKITTPFGYYPAACDVTVGDISIKPLTELQDSIQEVASSELVHNDWIYAPHQQSRDFMTQHISTMPYSSRVFGLPKTHELSHENADNNDHLDFLVWCIGFFVGMRLTATEAGFLDATPTKPNKLVDFLLANQTKIDNAITVSETYWQTHSNDRQKTKLITAIINGLFLSKSPQHLEFERFTYLYMVLDACFALTKLVYGRPANHVNHANRVEWMCDQFAMNTPDWARPGQNGTKVAGLRNPAFHEALFVDEPLGFAIFDGHTNMQRHINLPLEMANLASRFLVAIIHTPNNEYVKSSVSSRSIQPLCLN